VQWLFIGGAANARTTTSLGGHVNRDGSKLLVFIIKKNVQVGMRFQVLLEKGICFAGNDATSKTMVVENKCRRGASENKLYGAVLATGSPVM